MSNGPPPLIRTYRNLASYYPIKFLVGIGIFIFILILTVMIGLPREPRPPDPIVVSQGACVHNFHITTQRIYRVVRVNSNDRKVKDYRTHAICLSCGLLREWWGGGGDEIEGD